jgi:hypothetical protein
MRFIKTVVRDIYHTYTLTADVSPAYGHYYSPAAPLSYVREYNEHFASESRRVAVITTTIRMIRTTAQLEGNTRDCVGGG